MNLWENLEKAIAEHDDEGVGDALFRIEMDRLGEEQFPEEDFERLIGLLERPEFLQMEGASHLMMHLWSEREILSDDQVNRILAAYEKAYPRLEHWFAKFDVTECMSDICHDQRTLDMWQRLMNIEDDHARSFVAHAFEHLVKAGDPPVSTKAMELLLSMQSDPSEDVRYEVEFSLYRIEVHESEEE